MAFISKENNLQKALDLWNGKPSGSILWSLDAGMDNLLKAVKKAGFSPDYDDPWPTFIKFYWEVLGCLCWADTVTTFAQSQNDSLEIISKEEQGSSFLEYRHPKGVLTEERTFGEIVKHKVNSVDELHLLIKMWEDIEIVPTVENFYDAKKTQSTCPRPIVVQVPESSAVQHMLQRETGVANFWYLAMDCPDLLEEAMDIWQSKLYEKYKIMQSLPTDGWYQGENTSTTMISPEYYEKYSLEHMGKFVDSARQVNARSMVHMCGLLHGLMPLIRQTGMNGIHALSPPTIGDTPFDYAYDIMPNDFFAMGRFGSLEWIGRSREEILTNLARILPHNIYRDHAFMLLVTSDMADFTLDNLYLLRDCINEYEQLN